MHTAEDNHLKIVVHEHLSQQVAGHFSCVKTITNPLVHCSCEKLSVGDFEDFDFASVFLPYLP